MRQMDIAMMAPMFEELKAALQKEKIPFKEIVREDGRVGVAFTPMVRHRAKKVIRETANKIRARHGMGKLTEKIVLDELDDDIPQVVMLNMTKERVKLFNKLMKDVIGLLKKHVNPYEAYAILSACVEQLGETYDIESVDIPPHARRKP